MQRCPRDFSTIIADYSNTGSTLLQHDLCYCTMWHIEIVKKNVCTLATDAKYYDGLENLNF